MSVFTIAIIAAVILYSLFYIDCDKHGFLPDELAYAVFLGVIIDSIVLIICAAIRFGWWGFIISTIILVCLFFGIDEYAGKASPKEVQKFEEERERELKREKEEAEREKEEAERFRREYKTKQDDRYSSSVSLNGPAYGFVLGGPVRDFGLFGTPYALFGESPETIFSYWRYRIASTSEFGDSNKRTLFFDTKEDDPIHYKCSFERERLYGFSEWKSIHHEEKRLRDRLNSNYALSNSDADYALRKWKIEHPYVDNPEKWINEIENEIQLRSQKINAVVVKKAYDKWEEERDSEKNIRSEWEVIAPDGKKIKCKCEWKSRKRWDGGKVYHNCYISQEYELVE